MEKTKIIPIVRRCALEHILLHPCRASRRTVAGLHYRPEALCPFVPTVKAHTGTGPLMIRTLLLASTVLAGMTAVASAADLPRRAAPPPVFTPVPVFTWTGFYAGFNAGYAFDASSNSGSTFSVAPYGTTATFSQRNQEGF